MKYQVQWISGLAQGLADNLAAALNAQTGMGGYTLYGIYPHRAGELDGFIVVFAK